ncbi:MAG: DUF5615 family PIN-like protein [Verrucomicrobiota bacterium]
MSSLGKSPSDTEIWHHAQTENLVIITKDADFSDRIALSVPPPRVIHLRIGNLRLRPFLEFIANIWPQILELLPEQKLIAVYHDRVEGIGA